MLSLQQAIGFRIRGRSAVGAPAFTPASLFASGETGVWYDPSDISRYTADSTLGPELVTNGTFDSNVSDWTVANTASFVWSSGTGVYTRSAFGDRVSQAIICVVGRTYKITVSISGNSGGSARVGFNLALGANTEVANTTDASGTFSVALKATASTMYLQFDSNANGGTFAVDNISVRELTEIDTATMFQDTAGTTPVTAVEQPVGLMLDKSQGLVLGSELITNGDFSNGTTGWTITEGDASLSVVDGKLRMTCNADSTCRVSQQITTTASGKTHFITSSGNDGTASSIFFRVASNSTLSTSLSVNQQYTSTFSYSSYTPIISSGGTVAYVGVVSVMTAGQYVELGPVSIKELPGNHAVAANGSTARPVLRNRYNLLTYSQEFQTGWTASNSTITANDTTAPDGTMTADSLTLTTTTGFLRQTSTLAVGAAHTFSCSLKYNDTQWIWVYVTGITNSSVYVDIQNGTIGTTGAAVSNVSLQSQGDGWYRLTFEATTTTGTNYLTFKNVIADNTSTGSLTSTYIWGAQLTTAADHEAINGEYQRIAAAPTVGAAPTYDSDVTKFPPYLYATTDDAMSTASIDFSSGDEMSVFAGVTKESDAAAQNLVELSDNFNSYTDGFLVATNNGTAAQMAASVKGNVGYNSSYWADSASPQTGVYTFGFDKGATTEIAFIRKIGVSQSLTNNLSSNNTNNFGNRPLYLFARNNASAFYTGRLYSLIVRNALTTGDELANTESYVATKLGYGGLATTYTFVLEDDGDSITTDAGDPIYTNSSVAFT